VQQVATLNFIDHAANDEALVIIRAERDVIAVGFSLLEDGDMELVLRSEEWRQVLVHLQRALEIAESPGSE
jgi:hypothetical protein